MNTYFDACLPQQSITLGEAEIKVSNNFFCSNDILRKTDFQLCWTLKPDADDPERWRETSSCWAMAWTGETRPPNET